MKSDGNRILEFIAALKTILSPPAPPLSYYTKLFQFSTGTRIRPPCEKAWTEKRGTGLVTGM